MSDKQTVYDAPDPGRGTDARPLGQLLKDLTTDVTSLVKGEVELAKTEVKEGVTTMAQGLAEIVGGLLIGFVALIILLQALVVALANVMPDWLAAVIVGGVIAIVAFVLVMKGQSDLKKADLMPRRAVKHTQADIEMAKEHV